MRIPGEQQQRAGEENIVPMINVVFLLLIFFLLAGTLAPRPPFELDPVASTLQPPAQAPEGALYVAAGGAMFYRGYSVSMSSLPYAAKKRHDEPGKPFEVVLDRRVPGEVVFAVMGALGAAGFKKVRLVTERSVSR